MAQTMQLVPVQAAAPAPKSKIRTIVKERAKGAVKRGASAAARAAASEKHTLIAIVSAFAVGFAEAKGMQLPKVGPLSPAGTAGLAAWGIGKFTKSKTAQHVATGLLSVQAYQFGASGAKIAGDDLLSGDDISGEA